MQFLHPLAIFYLLLIAPLLVYAQKEPNEWERQMGVPQRYNAPEKATASVILLHGFVNSSVAFNAIPPRYYAQERFRHINFIFPNAPVWHEGGDDPSLRSWYDMLPGGEAANENQYWEVVDYVQDLVLNETAHGISPERIVAGGFSQGGMVAVGSLASSHVKIGGWWLFPSRVLHNLTRFDQNLDWVNKETPVFHGHGTNDTAIPVSEAIRTANLFKGLGFNYHLHIYPGMGHQTDWEPNDRDLEEWVAKTIPKKWGRRW